MLLIRLKKELTKRKKMYQRILLILILFMSNIPLSARSIYRPFDLQMPSITASWVSDKKKHTLRKYYLEEYSLFQLFDKEFFESHLLPDEPILFRNGSNKFVTKEKLTKQIDYLLQEIKAGKRTFTYFSILQSKDYNFKKSSGLLILKSNDFPFVIKLFIETPDSFVNPFDKGIEPIFVFFMGGGINRHLLGFTRIKNREIIQKRLKESTWANLIDIPRKWHWVPKNTKWIEIVGKNIGSSEHQMIRFPGTYCIIADAIQAERTPSLFNSFDTKMALDLCNYLDIWIDPHMKNFMIERGTGKFIIVDTEHFPSFVGLREKTTFASYSKWYFYLAGKCWKNAFMQTKKERRNPIKPNPQMSLVTDINSKNTANVLC